MENVKYKLYLQDLVAILKERLEDTMKEEYSEFDLGMQMECYNILDIIKHAILPSLTLTLLRLPDFYFVSRSAMLQQIQKKYVETAQAKSLGDIYILMRHCLPNAINPIMTRFLLSIQTMFNATLIVENVFKYPGIGKLIRDAVFYRDYLLLQGIFLVITIFILTISLLGENFYQTIEKRKEL